MHSRLSSMLSGVLLALLLLGATPARADWRRAESPHFILYGNLPEAELRQRILQLEDFDHLLRIIVAVTAPPAPNKLQIYLVRSHDELNQIHPMQTGVAGFYIASIDGIEAVIDSSQESSGNEILQHEYTHHFMLQYRPNAYPAWYVEGFAEYFMTARFDPHHIDIGNFSRGRVYGLTQEQWLPMDAILRLSPQQLGPDAENQFYAQSWLTVHYFFSTPERQAALGRFLVAARTTDPVTALHMATGMDPVAFAHALHDYIGPGRIDYHRMTRPAGETPPPVTVTLLPASANDLMLFNAALQIGMEDARGRAALPQIRAAAARHPGDPFAARVLATAEVRFGDPAAAARLLEPLLAAAPTDAELLYLRGMRYLVQAEQGHDRDENMRTARTWFERASAADPNHYQSLFRSAETLQHSRDYVSAANEAAMLRAHELAPQVGAITLNTASVLMSRGELARAVSLLRPLAAEPHDTRLAGAARQLLGQVQVVPGPAVGGDAPPKPPSPPPAAH